MFVNLYALASARGEGWVDPLKIVYVRRTSEGISLQLDGREENLRVKPLKVRAAMRKIVSAASAARMP